jgi:hypothetical protein
VTARASGGWDQANPYLLASNRYSFETRLRIERWRYVIGVKVYWPAPAAADGAQRALVDEVELEPRHPVVTTRMDPPLEIRVTRVGGRTYSLLEPGIY